MRLTLKNKEWACQLTTPMYDKLHDLEDIEDELGTDLITLYKAFKNGIWRKMFGGGIIHYESNQISVYIDHIDTDSGKELYLFDYGKEWALTKEELK